MNGCVGLPPCDPEIHERGEVIAAIPPGTLDASEIDRIITDFRMLTGLRIDWHYAAGRIVVKWLREKK